MCRRLSYSYFLKFIQGEDIKRSSIYLSGKTQLWIVSHIAFYRFYAKLKLETKKIFILINRQNLAVRSVP